MDVFDHPYYKLNKLFLKSIALWPGQHTIYIFYFRALYIVGVITCFTSQILNITKHEIDMDIIVQAIVIISVEFVYSTKYLTHLFYNDTIKKLIIQIGKDWESMIDEQELTIMRDFTIEGKRIAIFAIFYIYFTTTLYFLMPLVTPAMNYFKRERNHTYSPDVPLPGYYLELEEKYYVYIYIISMVGIYTMHTALIALDMIHLTLVQHICGLFNITSHRLQVAFDRDNEKLKDSDMICRKIMEGVRCHQAAIKFVNTINNCYGFSRLIIFTLSVIGLSVILVQLVTVIGQWNKTIMYLCFTAGILIHLFFNCYCGQKLITHSHGIPTKAYNTWWYMAPVKSQKLLLFIIRKTLHPSTLAVGKFYCMSFETCSSLIQLSVSYFTVIYSFK